MSQLTELMSINSILAAQGIRATTSVTNLHPAAIKAKGVLDFQKLEVQGDNKDHNTDERTLALDIEGNIILPSSTLEVDAVDVNKNYVQRGTKLYDVDNSTFVFTAPVKVRITVEQEFDDLPFPVANFIRRRAVHEAYINSNGDKTKTDALEKLMNRAELQYDKFILRSQDVNASNSPAARRLLDRLRRSSGRRGNPILPGG